MSINTILNLLPHRYPFLLVDRIVENSPPDHLVAIKNVTINEPFFQGHFPAKPVMPGVLVIEALAQATGLLSLGHEDVPEDSIFYLVGLDKTRFRRPVEPGDQLRLSVNLVKYKRQIGVFRGEAWVGDELCASTQIMCTARNDL
ncbi:MAG: 3-hydroxyacyl-ACP dehydratase FabZ [Pseudomonadota bacterium]